MHALLVSVRRKGNNERKERTVEVEVDDVTVVEVIMRACCLLHVVAVVVVVVVVVDDRSSGAVSTMIRLWTSERLLFLNQQTGRHAIRCTVMSIMLCQFGW